MVWWRQYEYWPTRAFYWPCYLWGPLQALRAGHPCFFTTLNPGWAGGGIGFESKYGILQDVPASYRPASLRIIPDTDGSGELDQLNTQYPNALDGQADRIGPHSLAASDLPTILATLAAKGITFPLIAKPDVGFRGLLVEIIDDPDQLQAYLRNYPIPIILQELIQLPEEIGILYYREPGKQTGRITSVTTKTFLHVIGDGVSTVRDLIIANDRAKRQLARLEKNEKELLMRVPKKGEKVKLGSIGNHSKGTTFLDGRHLISPELVAVFDRISAQMPHFTYGRFDLRCASFEHLLRGEYKILEINGALAEPTHLYDATKNNYVTALLDIMKHWYTIGSLSREQLRRGIKPLTPKQLLSRLFALKRYTKAIQRMEAAAKTD
ncbi:MAG: hypothetical protein AAF828_12285 [Bacteroidota bacterium]